MKVLAFDTETTGLSPLYDKITQLSYILYDTDSSEVLYSTVMGDDLVGNINKHIPKYITEKTGISDSDLVGKRPFEEHLDQFIDFYKRSDLYIAHNARYDFSMILGVMWQMLQEQTDNTSMREKYQPFLDTFGTTINLESGKEKLIFTLPDEKRCTMQMYKKRNDDRLYEEAVAKAAINGSKSKKIVSKKDRAKSCEAVHESLFRQTVGGKTHTALVDSAVVLRIYLMLAMDIDICTSFSNMAPAPLTSVKNIADICSLINPQNITTGVSHVIQNIDGVIIDGLHKGSADSSSQEINVVVNTQIIRVEELARSVAQQATDAALTTLGHNIPSTHARQEIKLCTKDLSSCDETNETCRAVRRFEGVLEAEPSLTDNDTDVNFRSEDILAKSNKKSLIRTFSNLFSKKNKVFPINGGKKTKKINKRKKTKKIKYMKKNKKRNKYSNRKKQGK